MEFEIPVPIGFALMLASVLWLLWRVLEARRLRSRFRVRPWLYRLDWREGIVLDKGGKVAWSDAVSAGGFFFLGLGSIFWSDLYAHEGWVPAAMILLFGGIPFLRRLWVAVNRDRSSTSFRFERVPFRVGGSFRGTVHIRSPFMAIAWADISLAARQADDDGDLVIIGGEIKKTIYQGQVTQEGTELQIPIELEISSSKLPSLPFQAAPRDWELRVSVPDSKYAARFVVPVFACEPDQVSETRYGRRTRRKAARAAAASRS